MPHAYYKSLADCVGDVGVPIETLEELGIEADRDEEATSSGSSLARSRIAPRAS